MELGQSSNTMSLRTERCEERPLYNQWNGKPEQGGEQSYVTRSPFSFDIFFYQRHPIATASKL
jgi:hypothetical protein